MMAQVASPGTTGKGRSERGRERGVSVNNDGRRKGMCIEAARGTSRSHNTDGIGQPWGGGWTRVGDNRGKSSSCAASPHIAAGAPLTLRLLPLIENNRHCSRLTRRAEQTR